MPTISFAKPRPSLEVEEGANLMQSLLSGGLPVASSCGGDGVCGKCRIAIVSAAPGALKPESELEKFLRERHSVPPGFRISCQVAVHGDITVDATYW